MTASHGKQQWIAPYWNDRRHVACLRVESDDGVVRYGLAAHGRW
jgi:hypothetical protein